MQLRLETSKCADTRKLHLKKNKIKKRLTVCKISPLEVSIRQILVNWNYFYPSSSNYGVYNKQGLVSQEIINITFRLELKMALTSGPVSFKSVCVKKKNNNNNTGSIKARLCMLSSVKALTSGGRGWHFIKILIEFSLFYSYSLLW